LQIKYCSLLLQSLNRVIIQVKNLLKYTAMKQGIHPENYRFVVFQDMSNNYSFLTKSTAPSKENIKWEDGNEYPLIKIEISNTSHPFYTGKMKLVDTAGRVDKFMNRYKDHITKKK
jgi:large subunit ribosomal protein L31